MRIIRFFLFIFSLILILVLTIGLMILLSHLQSKIFLPEDYILWVFKYPVSAFIFVFEFYFIVIVFALMLPKRIPIISGIKDFIKEHKKWIYPTFTLANLVLIYALIFNVSVITDTKIKDYSFFSPQGKVYYYSDIVSINTGVYGDRLYLPFPFAHPKGEFYYVITLNDGTKIDLNDTVGGTKKNQDRFKVFEEIDDALVNMGTKKIVNKENFELAKKDLAKIYTDRIKNILNNVK